MTKIRNPKQYDLEDRTLAFAKRVRNFVNRLSKSLTLIEDSRQLIRASGSVGANYIEANESLSKKDFLLKDQNLSKRSKGNAILTQFNPTRP